MIHVAHEDLTLSFDITEGSFHSVIIERPSFLLEFLSDLKLLANGEVRKTRISQNNTPIKSIELISDYLSLDLNKKNLISKVFERCCELALAPENYIETAEMLAHIENYFFKITEAFPTSFEISKCNISFLKYIGIQIVDDYDSLGLKLIDYMEAIREFECDKLLHLFL